MNKKSEISPRRRMRRVVLRLFVGAMLLAWLGAPSPGYTGHCGGGGAAIADPVQFCVSKETYVCARECVTGRWDAARCSTDCGSNEAIMSRCVVSWPAGCAPTQIQTNACLEALADMARIDTPSDMIPECTESALCTFAALSTPEGI